MAKVTLPPALLFLSLMVGPTGVAAKSLHPDYLLLRGEVQRYGDWLVGCDNQAECTMLGFPAAPEADEGGNGQTDMALRISLKGPADSAPLVEPVPFAATTRGPGGPFVLNVEHAAAYLSPIHGYSRRELLPAEAMAVIAHLVGNRRLAGVAVPGNPELVRFPFEQFGEAWRAMQERRAQLLEALADQEMYHLPGELPDGTTMPVAGRLQRRPAVPVIVSGFSPIFTQNQCGGAMAGDFQRYRFRGGAELWSYRCGGVTDAPVTHWEMAPSTGAVALPLDLPEPRGKVEAGVQGLENAVFDFDFGVLRSYHYQPGREDCGTFQAWGFTENGWHLLERREMPLCMGLEPGEWIRTHFDPTDGLSPDE